MKRLKVKIHTGSGTFEIIEISNTLSLHMGRNLTKEELACLIEDPSYDVTIVAPDKETTL